MRLNIKAFTFTAGILWGAAVFLTGIANLLWPGYGSVFLEIMASLYPGYDGAALLSSVIIGAIYAILDGAIAGLVFAWLYNAFSGSAAA